MQVIREYDGDEGLGRPLSAAPGDFRRRKEAPVPPHVLQAMAQFDGDEGYGRPQTATPSSMILKKELPVPPEIRDLMGLYEGGEGDGRPRSAAPSGLRVHANPRTQGLGPLEADPPAGFRPNNLAHPSASDTELAPEDSESSPAEEDEEGPLEEDEGLASDGEEGGRGRRQTDAVSHEDVVLGLGPSVTGKYVRSPSKLVDLRTKVHSALTATRPTTAPACTAATASGVPTDPSCPWFAPSTAGAFAEETESESEEEKEAYAHRMDRELDRAMEAELAALERGAAQAARRRAVVRPQTAPAAAPTNKKRKSVKRPAESSAAKPTGPLKCVSTMPPPPVGTC